MAFDEMELSTLSMPSASPRRVDNSSTSALSAPCCNKKRPHWIHKRVMARCDDWSSCMIALVMLHKVHKAWHEKVIFSTGGPVYGVVIDQDSRNKSQNGAVLLLAGRIVRRF